MIEGLILERDEMAGYVCLSVDVFGSRRLIYNASEEVNGYEAVKVVEKIAENLAKYTDLYLVEEDITGQ